AGTITRTSSSQLGTTTVARCPQSGHRDFVCTTLAARRSTRPRQYTSFAGIVIGQKTRDFFDRLTEERYATAYPCWRGTGRVFHVHHKGLYRAIGEADTGSSRW